MIISILVTFPYLYFFFFNDTATTEIYTLSLHDALPISAIAARFPQASLLVLGDLMIDQYLWGNVSRISPEAPVPVVRLERERSEEHTSELQSPCNLVCRLLLEKKKNKQG